MSAPTLTPGGDPWYTQDLTAQVQEPLCWTNQQIIDSGLLPEGAKLTRGRKTEISSFLALQHRKEYQDLQRDYDLDVNDPKAGPDAFRYVYIRVVDPQRVVHLVRIQPQPAYRKDGSIQGYFWKATESWTPSTLCIPDGEQIVEDLLPENRATRAGRQA